MTDADRHDVIVVGGGPAGCAAALFAARAGARVLVLDRGTGSGTVSGHVLYGGVWRAVVPELADAGLFERTVVRRRAIFLGSSAAASIDVHGEAGSSFGHAIRRDALDPWLRRRAEEAGAEIRIGESVDEILFLRGAVAGVRCGTRAWLAPIVIAAPGAGSHLLERAGARRGAPPPSRVILAASLRIDLAPEAIEARFSLRPGEGIACSIFGFATGRAAGSALLVANRESLGLTLLLRAEERGGGAEELRVLEILERLSDRPGVRELLAGGRPGRLDLRLVPALGRRIRRTANGLIAAGDAAGLAADTGRALAGIEPALLSGRLAGETAALALRRGDASRAILRRYEEKLRESGLEARLRAARRIGRFFRRTKFLQPHANLIVEAARRALSGGEPPRRRFLGFLAESLRGRPVEALDLLCDAVSAAFRL